MNLKSKRFVVPFAAGLLVGVILTLAAGASTPATQRVAPLAAATLDTKAKALTVVPVTKAPEIERNDAQSEGVHRDHPELNLQLE